MLKFDIIKQNGLARVGTIHTPHGDIQTPAFVGAATRATVKALTMSEMRALGSQAILANTYHLVLAPGVDLIEQAGGLAEFSGWHGPSFTDSGGFQILSLPGVKVSPEGAKFKSHINGDQLEMTPESSMRAQWAIGADIHMAFDQATMFTEHTEVETAMRRTHEWLLRCIAEHQKLASAAAQYNSEHDLRPGSASFRPEQYLYAVVQGGMFPDLREESTAFMKDLPVDGYGIGSLYTSDGAPELLTIMNSGLPVDKPRHFLGMGQEPMDLFVGAEYGCDTFDCVGPTRMARNGSLYTPDGRINIKNARFRDDFSPVMEGCDCECCAHYTRAYLHHLFKTDEITAKVLASIHNEHFVVHLTDQIRQALFDDTFEELKTAFLARYYQK